MCRNGVVTRTTTIANSGFAYSRKMTLQYTFEEGLYAIVPCTFYEKTVGNFTLSVVSGWRARKGRQRLTARNPPQISSAPCDLYNELEGPHTASDNLFAARDGSGPSGDELHNSRQHLDHNALEAQRTAVGARAHVSPVGV